MTKEELGGFAVRLFRDGDDYCSKVDYEFHGAPNMAIVYGIMTLIMQLEEENPNYPLMMAKVLAEHMNEKLDVRKVEDEA